MPFTNPGMVVMANAARAAITHLMLHSADPTAAGTVAPTTAARRPVVWAPATDDGDFALAAPVDFTGVAASGAVTWVSGWGSLEGGTCYGRWPLSGDLTATAAGAYKLSALSINGSSPT